MADVETFNISDVGSQTNIFTFRFNLTIDSKFDVVII